MKNPSVVEQDDAELEAFAGELRRRNRNATLIGVGIGILLVLGMVVGTWVFGAIMAGVV